MGSHDLEAKDKNGTVQAADRGGSESKPGEYPKKSVNESEVKNQLNNTEIDKYKGNSENPTIANSTNNDYYKGEQDDDDFETVVVLPKEFDLKLMKFISSSDFGFVQY